MENINGHIDSAEVCPGDVIKMLKVFDNEIRRVAFNSYNIELDSIDDVYNEEMREKSDDYNEEMREKRKEIIELRSDLLSRAEFIDEQIYKLAGRGEDMSRERTLYANVRGLRFGGQKDGSGS